jgi:uncharacterized protein YbbK (DUF523 family)
MALYTARPKHLPSDAHFQQWARKSAADALRVLSSACLLGRAVAYDGSDYGSFPATQSLFMRPEVRGFGFCPEDFSFGTPRDMCDIYEGNGFDVLDGKARVLTEAGEDWTEGMLEAAHAMLAVAQDHRVDLCIMLDVSAACGSSIISDGKRSDQGRIRGSGVCASLLIREGFSIVSQRDYATLARIHRLFEPDWQSPEPELDHYQHPWYVETFGTPNDPQVESL